ncbi:ganglioside GM2 activator-like [Scleropages formosus]|uniref:Ganglioside GM2 activator n=1 Tax=Scleropages formosus TaxID=113540 RepID=A0A0P7VE17_SCLFO|nr:ganglioside GM2 activator [Scleropages formosus]KPP71563.1 ganglioside GM2 activator-like [Scleropages formosus]
MQRARALFSCLCIAAVCARLCAGGAARQTQVLGFSWENCGPSGAPAVVKSLDVSPDPIIIPGSLTAAAAGRTTVELSSPLQVNLTLEKEVAGFWVKVPCLEDIGSCVYPDVCQLLDMVIPPGQDCPEPLHTYGLPCHCPFKAGDYTLPKSDFYVPYVELPSWLTNGNYRAEATVSCQQKEVACLKVSFSLHTE